jgi:hypothetical protein
MGRVGPYCECKGRVAMRADEQLLPEVQRHKGPETFSHYRLTISEFFKYPRLPFLTKEENDNDG